LKIFLNTQLQRLVIGTSQPSDVTQIDVKRGDNANFDCYAVLNFGDPYELDASVVLTDFRLTAKVPGALGAEDFIISALTWSKNNTGTSTFYRLAPSLDTTALNDLFAVGGVIATPATAVARLALTGLVVGNIVRQVDTGIYYQVLNASLLAFDVGTATPGWTLTEDREDYVDLAAEFEYVLDGLQVSYPTFVLRVYDDVSKGNESAGTTPVFPSFPNPSARATTYIAAFYQ
jgi:hypothetical protein